MGFVIGIIFFFMLIGIHIIVNIIASKRYIDLFNENVIEKIKYYNYKLLEIKRRRGHQKPGINILPYYEHPLEAEYPVPWSVFPPKDIIEVYGVENNNKYLLFKLEWSKENAQKIKIIVNNINELIKVNKN